MKFVQGHKTQLLKWVELRADLNEHAAYYMHSGSMLSMPEGQQYSLSREPHRPTRPLPAE